MDKLDALDPFSITANSLQVGRMLVAGVETRTKIIITSEAQPPCFGGDLEHRASSGNRPLISKPLVENSGIGTEPPGMKNREAENLLFRSDLFPLFKDFPKSRSGVPTNTGIFGVIEAKARSLNRSTRLRRLNIASPTSACPRTCMHVGKGSILGSKYPKIFLILGNDDLRFEERLKESHPSAVGVRGHSSKDLELKKS